jgi:4-amino-4-deoxy-L-arabinose transferase-like glycosyltransferase
VPVLLGLFLPWTGWLPVLLPHPSRGLRLHPRAWDRGALFLACWAFVPFLFFSFSSSKLPGYILPSLPPLALLLGMRFAAGTGHREDGAQPRGLRWFYLAVSLCAAAAMPVVLWANYGNAWLPGLPLAAAAAAPAAGAFMFARRGKPGAVIAGTALQGLLIVLAAIQFASPTLAAYHSARGIARQALAAAGGGEEIVTYCYFHHTLNYYTDYRTGPNLLDPPSLLAFARQHASFLVVTEMDRLGDLQGLPGLSVSLIAGQGKLRLLRITGSPAP